MTRRTSSNAWAATALALVAGLGLTACGNEENGAAEDPAADGTGAPTESGSPTGEPSQTPTEPAGPACTDVWVAGETLPAGYQGCQDTERDTWVQAMVYQCSSGQRLVTYQRTFYAAKGEVVVESTVPLARNPEFQRALKSCGA